MNSEVKSCTTMLETIHDTATSLADADPGRVYEVHCRDVAIAYLELEAKLAGIKALCQRFDTPAVNVGAQGLAKTVLRIVAGERDA